MNEPEKKTNKFEGSKGVGFTVIGGSCSVSSMYLQECKLTEKMKRNDDLPGHLVYVEKCRGISGK